MRKAPFILAVAALVLVSACSDDPTSPPKPDNGSMSAQIDGGAWSALSIATDSAAPSSLIITGTNTTRSLTISIPLTPGPGVQTVGSTTPLFAILVIGSQSWAASRTQGGAGTLTLTTVAPGRVAGTFEFTMASQSASPAARQVTSGKFDVKY